MTQTVSEEIAAALEALGIRRDSYELKRTPRIQKVIAERLTAAARDIPTFPLTVTLPLDALVAARAAFNAGREARVSVNDLFVRASALALMEVPAVNSSFTPHGIVAHAHADVSVAVAADSGLVTPIVRAADTKSVAEIAAEARELAVRARAGKLQPDEYVGGTFTVSNLGMYGVESFASIINPPQAAILSVGAAAPRVIVRDGGTAVETACAVTMTCDHRIVDGATGARWLQALRRMIEVPAPLFA